MTDRQQWGGIQKWRFLQYQHTNKQAKTRYLYKAYTREWEEIAKNR